MYKSSIYVSIFLLLINLIACQSDSKAVDDNDVNRSISNTDNTQSTDQEATKDKPLAAEELELKEELLESEKEEKLAKLEALKEKREALRLDEERIHQKRVRKREKAAKGKRALAREARRIKEEEEKELLISQADVEEIQEENVEPQGKLQFLKRSHDFGKIKEGDTFEHEFKFYNASQIPVVISNVKASCGCTQTTYPKEPILPGESGVIGVTFDSKGKLGRQKPFMSVVTNGNPSIYSLYMDGTVDTERE